jgi:hypothetical protein
MSHEIKVFQPLVKLFNAIVNAAEKQDIYPSLRMGRSPTLTLFWNSCTGKVGPVSMTLVGKIFLCRWRHVVKE